jgi:hypothetical protein
VKKLAIAAAAGLTLLSISTGVVLAGHAPGSGASRMQLSAATDIQPTASPAPSDDEGADEDSEAAENDNDQQGANEPQGHNNQKDDDRQGATARADDSQPAASGQQGR